MNAVDAENLYTNALEHGEGKNGLGTLFHYAKERGVNVGAVHDMIRAEESKMAADSDEFDDVPDSKVSKVSKVSGGVFGNVGSEFNQMIEGASPFKTLSTFSNHEWPGVLNKVFPVAMNDQQRDILLLSSLTVLGSMLASNVRVFYSHSYHYSTLQTFIVGPAASGKGVMSFTRWFAEPLDRERIKITEGKKKEYAIQKERYRKQKDDETIPEPVAPEECMYLSPGNITSSSLIRNIKASDGHLIIIETEAETLSAANKNELFVLDYIFRNGWDHAPLSMSRVMNNLVIKMESYFLGVLLSGTPKQFKTFIQSTENGSFSRFSCYFVTPEYAYIPQTSNNGIDGKAYFKRLGEEWYEVYKKIISKGIYTLVMTKEQEKSFHVVMERLYKSALVFSRDDMDAFVKRLPANILRMMSVVAVVRAFEAENDYLIKESLMVDSRNKCKIKEKNFE